MACQQDKSNVMLVALWQWVGFIEDQFADHDCECNHAEAAPQEDVPSSGQNSLA